jgi:hypothetical protein
MFIKLTFLSFVRNTEIVSLKVINELILDSVCRPR